MFYCNALGNRIYDRFPSFHTLFLRLASETGTFSQKKVLFKLFSLAVFMLCTSDHEILINEEYLLTRAEMKRVKKTNSAVVHACVIFALLATKLLQLVKEKVNKQNKTRK